MNVSRDKYFYKNHLKISSKCYIIFALPGASNLDSVSTYWTSTQPTDRLIALTISSGDLMDGSGLLLF